MKFNLTQSFALGFLYRELRDFLYDYAEGKIEKEFFVNGMAKTLEYIDVLIRENEAMSISSYRQLIIKKPDAPEGGEIK